jgi:pentatricopeptide repeat protein
MLSLCGIRYGMRLYQHNHAPKTLITTLRFISSPVSCLLSTLSSINVQVGPFTQQIQTTNGANGHESAMQVFSKLMDSGLEPNKQIIREIIVNLCNKGFTEDANQIFMTLSPRYDPLLDEDASLELMNANIEANNPDLVLQVFDHVSPSKESYELIFKAFVERKFRNQALSILTAALQHQCRIDSKYVERLLNDFFDHGEIEEARQLYTLIRSKNKLSDRADEAMLCGCIRNGLIDQAIGLINGHPADRMVGVWKQARNLLKNTNHPRLLQLQKQKPHFWKNDRFDVPNFQKQFDAIREKSIQDYTEMFYMYGLYGDFHMIAKISQQMLQENIAPDTIFFNTIMYFLTDYGDFTKAYSIFHMMRTKFGMKPTIETYTNFIYRAIRTNRSDTAIHMYTQMLQDGITPNAELLKAISSAYIRVNGVQQTAKWVDSVTNKYNLEETATNKENVLHQLCKTNISDAITYLHNIENKYTRLYSIIMQHVSNEQVITLAMEMKKNNVRHNGLTIHCVIHACMELQVKLKQIFIILGFTLEKNDSSNRDYYHLIRELLRYGRASDAKSIMGKDLSAMSMVLSYYCKTRTDTQVAIDFFEYVKTVHKPGVYHYSALLKCLYRSESISIAEKYFAEMTKNNVKPSAMLLKQMIHTYNKLNEIEKLAEIVREIEKGAFNLYNYRPIGTIPEVLLLKEELGKIGKEHITHGWRGIK